MCETTDVTNKKEMCETTDGMPSSLITMRETETSKYEDIVIELNAIKEELIAEKKLSNDLKHRLQLKAVSIDCQIIETESLLDISYAQNEDLSKQIELLKKENESTLQQLASLTEEKESTAGNNASLKRENQSLLQRTATLARRDQIQKASIMTYEDDIVNLISTVDDFQSRFESLAFGLKGHNETEKNSEQTWKAEKDILNGCIEKLKSDNNGMKIKFLQTLTKHQSAWQSERDLLQNQITELVSEKKKDHEKEESFKEEITELLATLSTPSTSDERADTTSTSNDVTTVTSGSINGETTDTSSTCNDESLSQLTHEQLHNDLNNAERKFDKVNPHNGRTPTTNDESPSQITQEQLRNDLDNVEHKFNKVNAHKARWLCLTESLIPSYSEAILEVMRGDSISNLDVREELDDSISRLEAQEQEYLQEQEETKIDVLGDDTSSTSNDESLSQLTHEQLRHDLDGRSSLQKAVGKATTSSLKNASRQGSVNRGTATSYEVGAGTSCTHPSMDLCNNSTEQVDQIQTSTRRDSTEKVTKTQHFTIISSHDDEQHNSISINNSAMDVDKINRPSSHSSNHMLLDDDTLPTRPAITTKSKQKTKTSFMIGLESERNNIDNSNNCDDRTPTTNDESPFRNDLNNVEHEVNKVNAHKAQLLFLTKSLIPSSVEEGEHLDSVDTRDAICITNVPNSNNGTTLIDIEDRRE
ncbi:hypothetical protein FRACYDRAFT_233323 [Fragilariopsis cylindrus CCMP1102]|uniref:Uncharacterized protein n=1 Tax=Fragilariopsis cylindrus CCMP1102 TaxID=635003 RepID=A0A1E7FYE7_9STRA|nr:hypothetical protein FRACYDRAFT_233323 [Fragilariopsis cylindrus CCMP1102]|eukprot:OEU23154.1 hypothetical protein FRACYDRAFT_233323 [Fragilariopsis cylindrus CCMP1102]